MQIVPSGCDSPNVSHMGTEFEMAHRAEASDQSGDISMLMMITKKIINKGEDH